MSVSSKDTILSYTTNNPRFALKAGDLMFFSTPSLCLMEVTSANLMYVGPDQIDVRLCLRPVYSEAQSLSMVNAPLRQDLHWPKETPKPRENIMMGPDIDEAEQPVRSDFGCGCSACKEIRRRIEKKAEEDLRREEQRVARRKKEARAVELFKSGVSLGTVAAGSGLPFAEALDALRKALP